jgi:ABC-type nitrate/sulfonate/bicarbonate transport system permease component
LGAALGLGTAVIVLAILEAMIATEVISPYVLPPPSAILGSFGRVIMEEHVLQRFLLTAGEALAAGVLLTVVGISFGVLLSRRVLLRRAVETWVAALASAPLVLAYPLFLVIFGRNALTIVMIGFAAGLAPVVLKTLEGLTGVRPVLINVARSYRLSDRQAFWKVMFPAAVPTIFVGLRLGLIFALINIVGVEFLINFGGLGQLINELAERYDLPGTYAAICFVVLVSVIFFAALERAERWVRPGAA